MPGSAATKWPAIRAKRPAPITRASDSAICATTSGWRGSQRRRRAGIFTGVLLEIGDEIAAREGERGAEGEEQRGQRAEDQRGADEHRRGRRGRGKSSIGKRLEIAATTRSDDPDGAETTERAADEREHEAFGQELADEAGTRAAEREADGELLAPRVAADEEEAGEVERDDEQHGAGQAQEHGGDETDRGRFSATRR